MTNSEKNVLFLDNAMDLPYNKKIKILKSLDIDMDMHANFSEIEPKLAEILTPRELSSVRQSARQ